MRNNITIKQFVLILIMLILFFFIANNNPFYQQITKIKNTPILDMRINYSPDEAYKYFDDLGNNGRKIYIEFLLIVDIIFPIGYSVLFFLILSFFLQRIVQKNNIMNFIKYIPFAVGGFDIIENILEIILLLNYPGKMIVFAISASIATTIKMILGYFIIILLLVIIIIFIFQKLLIKKDKAD